MKRNRLRLLLRLLILLLLRLRLRNQSLNRLMKVLVIRLLFKTTNLRLCLLKNTAYPLKKFLNSTKIKSESSAIAKAKSIKDFGLVLLLTYLVTLILQTLKATSQASSLNSSTKIFSSKKQTKAMSGAKKNRLPEKNSTTSPSKTLKNALNKTRLNKRNKFNKINKLNKFLNTKPGMKYNMKQNKSTAQLRGAFLNFGLLII